MKKNLSDKDIKNLTNEELVEILEKTGRNIRKNW